MKKQSNRLILFLVSFIFSISAYAQTTISGKVIDKKTKEPIIGASVDP